MLYAEFCTTRINALELVEDADWLQGRFAAACCALGTRSGWHVSIWFEGQSGHLERVEIFGSIQEIFCLLLAVETGL